MSAAQSHPIVREMWRRLEVWCREAEVARMSETRFRPESAR